MRVANACDAGGSYAVKFFNVSCGGFAVYTVSPNPASSEVTIKPADDAAAANSTTAKTTTGAITQVTIYDQQGIVQKQQKFTNQKTVKLNVSSLRTGIYFIEITAGSYTERQQLSVLK